MWHRRVRSIGINAVMAVVLWAVYDLYDATVLTPAAEEDKEFSHQTKKDELQAGQEQKDTD